MGEALAELVRRGANPQCRLDESTIFPHFAVPAEAAPLTLESTLEADDDI